MIDKFQLIRNVGRFDSFAATLDICFSELTLIYGENGKGKTTLSAILRSLSSGDPNLINERHRLGGEGSPHVVIPIENGTRTAVFENGAWSFTYPDILVFDDFFVHQNVHSGLLVEAGQRQNLHELIIGREGVALARRVDELTKKIADLHSKMREKEARITDQMRGRLSVDEFCALPHIDEIEKLILNIQRQITALKQAQAVHSTSPFAHFALPTIDLEQLSSILLSGLKELDKAALNEIRAHFTRLGPDGEEWISTGMGYLLTTGNECPFCGLDLGASHLLTLYQLYFGELYAEHKRQIVEMRAALGRELSGDELARFQREIETARKRHQFWMQFLEIPELPLDIEQIAGIWQDARDVLVSLFDKKIASPLDEIQIDEDSLRKLSLYVDTEKLVSKMSHAFQSQNETIARLKVDTEQGNIAESQTELERFLATKARFSGEVNPLCSEYLLAKKDKEDAERSKAELRERLDEYRARVIPLYQAAINEILRRFNADFQIVEVEAVNPRGRPSSTYCIEINAHRIPVTGAEFLPGHPSFRSTLSSGDRNTLALAFFFAWLEQEPNLGSAIVVIDDPITSLDEVRSLATAQEIRGLLGRSHQTIVLSHSKGLLCAIWTHVDQARCSTLEVRRSVAGSTFTPWNIQDAAITEYDRRHCLLREYNAGLSRDIRQVAQSLRPVLEGFLRVACAEHFPPGMLLGNFINRAHQLENTSPIIPPAALLELEQIKEYANRFHHDTNPAWDTEISNINETQLLGFVKRVLDFTRKV